MKAFFVILLLLVVLPSAAPAQTSTVDLSTPKTATLVGTNVTFGPAAAALDTIAIGQRYALRMGLKWKDADTLKSYNNGITVGKLIPPDQIQLGGAWAPATYNKVP
jgi:hypothetical protein